MSHFFKTKGIYGKSDTIQSRIEYRKGKGYFAQISPCYVEDREGVNLVGCIFDRDYFNYYQTVEIPIIACERKTAKRTEEAERIFTEKEAEYVKKYIDIVKARGGIEIELID